LEYRLIGAKAGTIVDVWYTRDRGRTWHPGDDKGYTMSPARLEVPAEGLYGFVLSIRKDPGSWTPVPMAGTRPQRWVFVDATPPLLQWDAVEPAENFATSRRLHLRWTAYDGHLPARPVSIAWQSSIDQIWHVLEEAIPNTGRYDWTVPETVTGQLTLNISVCDEGGHAVERMFGPVSIDQWMKPSVLAKSPASQPATQPATPDDSREHVAGWMPTTNSEERRKATQLYRKGSWYLLRGDYAIAAERFREALKHDPEMLDALNDLAGIHYLQKDYTRAEELYGQILKEDPDNTDAMRGSFLASVAQRQYPRSRSMLRRLLMVDDQDAEAWVDLGWVLFRMGDRQSARSHWQHALTIEKAPADVIDRAERFLREYKTVP
jgi:Tfp pilus assembly protein PilF